jgi:glutamyl-tRNA reductase
MNIPTVDLKELKRLKEDNFKERLEFIEKYSEWVKKKTDKEWSKQQKVLIDSQL